MARTRRGDLQFNSLKASPVRSGGCVGKCGARGTRAGDQVWNHLSSKVRARASRNLDRFLQGAFSSRSLLPLSCSPGEVEKRERGVPRKPDRARERVSRLSPAHLGDSEKHDASTRCAFSLSLRSPSRGYSGLKGHKKEVLFRNFL